MVGGQCNYICNESDAAIDYTTMMVNWQRIGSTLEGEISCKYGYHLEGMNYSSHLPSKFC